MLAAILCPSCAKVFQASGQVAACPDCGFRGRLPNAEKTIPAWLPVAVFMAVLLLVVVSIGYRFQAGPDAQGDLTTTGDPGLDGLADLTGLDILQNPAETGNLRNETGADVPDVLVFTGTGRPQIAPVFEMTGGLLQVHVEHTGADGYFRVAFDAVHQDQERKPFVAAPKLGAYEAVRYVGLAAGTYALEVQADGFWRVELSYPDADGAVEATGEISGSSLQAAPPVRLPAGDTDITFTHSGDFSHQVRVFDWTGNELGDSTGCWFFGHDDQASRTCTVAAEGPYFFDIKADRSWSLTF